MRKIISVFLSLYLFVCMVGCNEKAETQFEMSSVQLPPLLSSTNDVELLRNEGGTLYLNELDTEANPFLFTTRALHLISIGNDVTRTIEVVSNKRIVDCVIAFNKLYYFNLVEKNGEFLSELCYCSVDSEEITLKEESIKVFSIDDPYAYPRFVKYGDSYCYKINNCIYDITNTKPIKEEDKDIFISKSVTKKQDLSYKRVVENGYEIIRLYDGAKIGVDGNIGNFVLIDNNAVYTKDNSVICFDLEDKSERTIYSGNDIFDFSFYNEKYVVISTEKSILCYDFKSNKKVGEVSRPDGSIGWLYSDSNGNLSMYSSSHIYKFSID
ncbi:MAG: hypothetical protein UIG59_07210 [Acutalibacteraceae bacterium]|nr:hypothetical protein [Acutalibacteraceae bacterium]